MIYIYLYIYYIYVYIYICIYIYTYTYVYTCVFISSYTCVFISSYTCKECMRKRAARVQFAVEQRQREARMLEQAAREQAEREKCQVCSVPGMFYAMPCSTHKFYVLRTHMNLPRSFLDAGFRPCVPSFF